MLRKNLDFHLRNECPKRQYICQHCGEAGCYDERDTHLQVCPMVEFQCTKCKQLIIRRDCQEHHLTCSHELALCKYYKIGRKEKQLRKDIKKHEEDAQFHLAIAMEKVLALTSQLMKNSVTFSVTNYKQTKELQQELEGPHFFTSKSGYKFLVCVHPSGNGAGTATHVSVFAYLMKGDNDDSLTWPFTTIELLNQLEDKNHHKKSVTFQNDDEASKRVMHGEKALMGYGSAQFISHSHLDYQPDKNCQYLKDDTLVFRVSAEASDYKPWLECTSRHNTHYVY